MITLKEATYVHFAKSYMTLGIHRGTNIRCRGTSGISISCRSTSFAGLGTGITATGALVLAGWTSGR